MSNTGEITMLDKNNLKTATFIKIDAVSTQTNQLKDLLVKGATIIQQTEPETKLWFALKENDNDYGIFDIFPNVEARAKHFQGKVAAALNENADNLIVGGWDNGVLKNISNYEVMSLAISDTAEKATEATYIILEANPGKENDLRDLLISAAQIIEDTESKTLFWVSLQLNDKIFAIFDTFSDGSGRDAHFAGKVANALMKKSEELVVNGWENGVLKNVHNFSIIAQSSQ